MNSSDVLGVAFGFIGILFIFLLAVAIFMIVVKWKMYEKAGKPGWASIVPVYSTIVLFDIIGYKWYYIFLLFWVPLYLAGKEDLCMDFLWEF